LKNILNPIYIHIYSISSKNTSES